MKRKAFGSSVWYSTASTGPFINIGQIHDISGPEISVESIDVTTHGSASGFSEYMPGIKEAGEVSFDIIFDSDSGSSHVELCAVIDRAETLFFQIRAPGSIAGAYGLATDSIAFSGFLTALGRTYPVKDALKGSVKIKATGPVKLTPRNAWNPLFLSNLYAWFDGVTNKFNSIAPDLAAGAGQSMRAWKSRDIAGLQLDQATGTNQPQSSVTGVVFDGVNDLLSIASTFANAGLITVAAAYQKTSSDSVIMEFGNAADFTNSIGIISSATVATVRRSNGAPFLTANATVESGFNAILATYGTGGLLIRSHLSAIPSVNAAVSTQSSTTLRIGGTVSGVTPYTGEIRDVIIAGELSASDQILLGQYVASRIGKVWA